MESKLVNEIMDVVNEIGVVIKKWEEIYCMVEVNKVFVYYCYQVIGKVILIQVWG